MAAEAIRWWRAGSHHGCGHVPALAHQAAHWGVVSEHGHAGTYRVIFCHGDISLTALLCDGVYSQAWPLAISKPIRGCGLL